MVPRVVIWIAQLAVAFGLWIQFEPLLRYRQVPATVLSAQPQHGEVRVGRTGRGGLRGFRMRSGFVPGVAYRYEVDGVPYVGSEYNRLPTLESSKAVTARLGSIVPGTTVTAWYDPSDPSQAVLSRAPSPILVTILAVVALFCGLFSMVAKKTPRTA